MYIVGLGDPACCEATIVGNKAARLALLSRLGYRIPDAFCVTHHADEFWGNPRQPNYPQFLTELTDALAALNAPWAIRSSSTCEDDRGASFAGLFATVLDISTLDGVVDAARIVSRSRNREIIKIYAKAFSIDVNSIHMAVIVQTMLRPTASGVAFSAYPLRSDGTVLIESTIGLGDALVGGSLDPERITVDANGSIAAIQAVDPSYDPDHGCSTSQHRTAGAAQVATLSLRQAQRLADIVRSIEVVFGTPQDVEWALAAGQFYILQTRPITA